MENDGIAPFDLAPNVRFVQADQFEDVETPAATEQRSRLRLCFAEELVDCQMHTQLVVDHWT